MASRFDVRVWSLAALLPTALAACANAPTQTAPAAQTATNATYKAQGGVGGYEAHDMGAYGAPGPMAAPLAAPAVVAPYAIPATIGVFEAGSMLYPLDYVSAHPILDYSWYAMRGNFPVFGWAPGFEPTTLGTFMYLNVGPGWLPYAYNSAAAVWSPYTTVIGGQTAYPFLGYGDLGYYSVGSPWWDYGLDGFGIGGFGGIGFTGRRGFGGRGGFTGRRGGFGGRGGIGGRAGIGGRGGGRGR